MQTTMVGAVLLICLTTERQVNGEATCLFVSHSYQARNILKCLHLSLPFHWDSHRVPHISTPSGRKRSNVGIWNWR
jgi:hypothetical protein